MSISSPGQKPDVAAVSDPARQAVTDELVAMFTAGGVAPGEAQQAAAALVDQASQDIASGKYAD